MKSPFLTWRGGTSVKSQISKIWCNTLCRWWRLSHLYCPNTNDKPNLEAKTKIKHFWITKLHNKTNSSILLSYPAFSNRINLCNNLKISSCGSKLKQPLKWEYTTGPNQPRTKGLQRKTIQTSKDPILQLKAPCYRRLPRHRKTINSNISCSVSLTCTL